MLKQVQHDAGRGMIQRMGDRLKVQIANLH